MKDLAGGIDLVYLILLKVTAFFKLPNQRNYPYHGVMLKNAHTNAHTLLSPWAIKGDHDMMGHQGRSCASASRNCNGICSVPFCFLFLKDSCTKILISINSPAPSLMPKANNLWV